MDPSTGQIGSAAAVGIGLATFAIGMVIAVIVFAVLGVDWIFLVGPAIGVAAAALAAYRTAGTATSDRR